MEPLGRLTRDNDLRSIWSDEARDFTPWLSQNLGLLGELLGMDLESAECEVPVGDYRIDICAKELGSARLVVIENQLEATNHNHLGQLITYAAGVGAQVVIWVCRELRDEHRRALDWLNQSHGDKVQFFGVTVELLRVDDSKPAVNFRPVVVPLNWSNEPEGTSSEVRRDTSKREERYAAFFQETIDELRTQHRFTNARVAQPQNWYSFTSGVFGFRYALSFAQGGRIRAEIYIDTGDAETSEQAFELLKAEKAAVEAEFGEPLEWEPLEGRRACRIAIYRTGSIDESDDALFEHRKWAIDRLLRFKHIFGPRLERVSSSV